ncbi:MAG: histidine kinase [Candidatus Eremiobacteraeota bacterium]|nr:histidine kinase [Candidatus Eremiobacteraeota bacterium]
MLLLADPGGEFLDRLLGQPMELTQFLHIAIALSGALARLHACGLIHKDVKPANILFEPKSGAVRLMGFGIASRLPRERQAPSPPEFIAGTLAYMAPEQTGRMNRSIDARSDLYSLGVTLYEMATGVLPFAAADPLEWVHCHIARQPVPPRERVKSIPEPVSAIIMKLLAKTAEERYQTGAGAQADLRRCLSEREAGAAIAPFPLGTHDVSDRLRIPERLYGREREFGTLLGAFERVVEGGVSELVLVSGYSGIGKSAVVNELHKALVPPRGLFAAGKFDQYKRNVPYATLSQAFQTLVRQILCKSEEEVSQWRDALREALGVNGQLIVNLIPELELVIEKQPLVADLPPQDAQRRFQRVFRQFLGVFARPEHPLALFLDDLQWLDAATLALMEDLLTHADVRHLLLVGAYRDNEVSPSHPLMRTLEAIHKSGARVQEIVLSPLALDDVSRLVADALHSQRAQPLAELVYEKTGGNPFFTIQFLTALAEEHLLAFDVDAATWMWDLARIRGKGYSDNVVELMIGKLKRLPSNTQEALKLLACLGNVAEIATLTMIRDQSEEALHTALWDAARTGLMFRVDGTYTFLHDRVQEAAYALIPDGERTVAHLAIGRLLVSRTAPEELEEKLFEIVNQFNRGAALLIDRDEKTQVATLDLRAGRKAKASAAYASACVYLAAGMALLDESHWRSQYDLMFGLWLERADCEFLNSNFDEAERLISELLARSASKVDQAAAYRVKVDLHVVKSENAQAVNSALECLRLFGIEMSAHPTPQQVRAEYENVWKNLDERSIESLIDLPLMTDREMQAAMRTLTLLYPPALFTDINLVYLHLCHMVNVSLKYGTTDASTPGFSWFGTILGQRFHRYTDGYRFGKLACELVEKRDFLAYKAKTYFSMEMVVLWTQPVTTALQYIRQAFRAGVETGDLAVACYSCNHTITDLLLRGDPLDEVWRETERGLNFVRKANFRDVADVIVSQQRFIQNMRGETTAFSTFSDAEFQEETFEADLGDDRMSTMVCWYWVIKLQARFFSGNYDAAIAAAEKAKALLWSSDSHIQLLDYNFYSALAIAAVYNTGPLDRQPEWLEQLRAHADQLREWAENCSATFPDKHALVAAEIARIEGRDLDAMHLYERAIGLAREQGFVQNEGLAHELAARFYAARGFEVFAHTYLRNARYCYLRWGAAGKVRQLNQLYPHLRGEESVPGPTSTIGASVEQLDLATVMKVSQAVSGEIVLEKLIDTLMRTAIEHAGAERGLLILPRSDELRITAEATTGSDEVVVRLQEESVAAVPESIVHYVARTQQSVILDDASAENPFSGDTYIGQRHARSILCLPLVNQSKLIGVLYLENNLTPHVFTPTRTAVLKLLASQAAISLENTRLYGDLQQREAKIRRLVDANIIGVFMFNTDGEILEANEALLAMVGFSREEVVSGRVRFTELTPPEWQERHGQALAELRTTGTTKPYEKEYFRKDGSRVPVLVGAAMLEGSGVEGVAFVLDLSEQKRAEEALREAQAEVTRTARLTMMGELTASIAHEINQPIAAIVMNGSAGLRWLNKDEPDVEEARSALTRLVNEGKRAGNVIRGLRALVKKSVPEMATFDINDAIQEILALNRSDLLRQQVSVHADLFSDQTFVRGDRVQLQQVVLNLIKNAAEAMSAITDRAKMLKISGQITESGEALILIEDTGPGLDPVTADRIFERFFTTKPTGMGMGLSISRSIIESHGGRLWASARSPHGTAFHFTIPTADR